MKLSLKFILERLENEDEQELDPRIRGLIEDLKQIQFKSGINVDYVMNFLAKRHKLNRKNRQEEGLLNGFMVAIGLLDPSEANGDPEHYQEALWMWKNLQ